MDFKSASKILILALASSSFALTALAQWQWIDKDGSKVFSDRPPPGDIPAKNVLKQPPAKTAPPKPVSDTEADDPAAAPSAPQARASAPKLSGKDAELEAKKKQAEEEEAAKKKADEQKRTQAQADNCARARKGLVTMQSGIRIAVTNAKGESEFMDDAARAAETRRIRAIVDSDCKK